MFNARTVAVSVVLAATVLCGATLINKAHESAMDNAGVAIAYCVDHNEAAGALYVHTFYTRPILIAWRCIKN